MELLLQKDTFTEDELGDTEAVIRRYFDVKIVRDETVVFAEKISLNGGVFRGTLALAAKVGKRFPWADALVWAPAFRESLVSKPFLFLDAAGILAAPKGLLPFSWPLFVRPTSGFKTFSGNVFTRESFDREFQFLVKTRNGDPFTVCMLAEPRTIKREWRTIFVNNEYSSGSQYMLGGEKVLQPGVPDEIVAFAREISKSPYFQNVFDFTLDIADTDRGLGMLEVNGFETASFYAADLDKVYSDWARALSNPTDDLA